MRGMVCAALVGGLVVGSAASAGADERRADVRLVASPAAIAFPAGGSATVRLDYSNVGNVVKNGSTISAEIPAGVTVEPRPAPGWECHIDDFPALVCTSADDLVPGQAIVPAEVVLGAAAPVRAEIEFGTLGFYRDPTENPADNYSRVAIEAS